MLEGIIHALISISADYMKNKNQPEFIHFMKGRLQVGVAPAIRITMARALRDKVRLILGFAWCIAVVVMLYNMTRQPLYAAFSAFIYGAFLALTSPIPWRIKIYRGDKNTAFWLLLLNGSLALVLGIIFFWISCLPAAWIFLGKESVKWMFAHPVQFSVWALFYPIVGIGITWGEDYERHNRILEARARRLEKLEGQSRAIALRAQINPHFFFNALNTIASLIQSRPEDAERAVELLAQALRPVLKGDQPLLREVEKEIETARAYAEIEQLRLGDRLKIDFDVPDNLDGFLMPSLSLQPLLENAVRHGAMKTLEDYHIRLSVRRDKEGLTVVIKNAPEEKFTDINPEKMTPVKPEPGHAVHNIIARMAILFDDRASCIIRTREPATGYARLHVPQMNQKEISRATNRLKKFEKPLKDKK